MSLGAPSINIKNQRTSTVSLKKDDTTESKVSSSMPPPYAKNDNLQIKGNLAERYQKLQKDPQKGLAAYKLEFPFNLDSLFTLSYSFDTLKSTIDYLAQNQFGHAQLIEQIAEDIEEAKREFFLVKGIGPSIKELCMRELTVSLNEQVLERNEAIKLLKQEIMDMHGRQNLQEERQTEIFEEQKNINQRFSGLELQTQSVRSEMEPIHKRHHELMYLEREIEEIQKNVEQLQNLMKVEIHGIQSKVGNLQNANEARLQEELGKRKKVAEQTNTELMSMEEKMKQCERLVKDLESKIVDQDKKVENADKKASTHAGLIKDLDLRQFKNEIRMGQLDNRITDTEQRVSADGRKIQTIERNGIANMGSGDPWYDMPSSINIKNKKNNYQKKESSVGALKSPKKEAAGNTLRESKDSGSMIADKETSRKQPPPTVDDDNGFHGGGGGPHMNQEMLRELIQEMIDEYKKQVNESKFVNQEGLDLMEQRLTLKFTDMNRGIEGVKAELGQVKNKISQESMDIEELKNDLSQSLQRIDQHDIQISILQELQNLGQDLELMKKKFSTLQTSIGNKVDGDHFDEQIEALKVMMNSRPAGGNTTVIQQVHMPVGLTDESRSPAKTPSGSGTKKEPSLIPSRQESVEDIVVPSHQSFKDDPASPGKQPLPTAAIIPAKTTLATSQIAQNAPLPQVHYIQAPNQLSTSQLNRIKEVLDKFGELEESHTKLQNDFKKQNFNLLKDQVELMNKKMTLFATLVDFKGFKLEVMGMNQRVDKHQEDIKELFDITTFLKNNTMTTGANITSQEGFQNLKSQVEKMDNSLNGVKRLIDGFRNQHQKSQETMKRILISFSEVEAKVDNSGVEHMGGRFDRMSQLFEDRFNNMVRLLEWKADREHIDQAEKRMKEMLDDFAKGIAKYADKDEVYRKLLTIDRQIKKLLEMKTQASTTQPDQVQLPGAAQLANMSDEGMLIKKPLGPGTCLSCDKMLSRFGGMGEYKSWKKLPKENAERSQKYGPGYSKVLQKMKRENSASDSPRERLLANADLPDRMPGMLSDDETSPPKYEPGEGSHHFLPESIKGATLEPPPPPKFNSSLNNAAGHYYKNKSQLALKPSESTANPAEITVKSRAASQITLTAPQNPNTKLITKYKPRNHNLPPKFSGGLGDKHLFKDIIQEEHMLDAQSETGRNNEENPGYSSILMPPFPYMKPDSEKAGSPY